MKRGVGIPIGPKPVQCPRRTNLKCKSQSKISTLYKRKDSMDSSAVAAASIQLDSIHSVLFYCVANTVISDGYSCTLNVLHIM